METTDAINWLTQKDVKPTSNRILVLKKLKAEARPVTLLDLSNKMLTMDKSSIFRVLALFLEHLDERSTKASRNIPVNTSNIITTNVFPDTFKLNSLTFVKRTEISTF